MYVTNKSTVRACLEITANHVKLFSLQIDIVLSFRIDINENGDI